MAGKRKSPFKAADLINIGYPQGKIIGIALDALSRISVPVDKEVMLDVLRGILKSPQEYLKDKSWRPVALALLKLAAKPPSEIMLRDISDSYAIYGAANIEEGAMRQMDIAMRLPIAVSGALMPDAHQGYGLPIGGVLAVENAVIPYGVGVDIGCRMCLSIYNFNESYFTRNESQFKRELINHTKFGAGETWTGKAKTDHAVLHHAAFREIPLVKSLLAKSAAQLGTSGGGNHFVEFGIIDFKQDHLLANLKQGRYVALLSHSGSRGMGATIAAHYTKIAKQVCQLPPLAANLAYMHLDSAEGQEYWEAMTLAGHYASACHEVIHNKLTSTLGANVLARVENHHNFAWKEQLNGMDVVVHRKGATPAAAGVLGIIPGSMTASGYLVKGKGSAASINSASHGAGRQMSRTAAIKGIDKELFKSVVQQHGVTLIGGGLDEAPMAYKDIDKVMSYQTELIDVLATFTPKLVRMAEDGSRED